MNKEQIEKMIAVYLQAEIDVLAGKSTTINGKQMAMEDLDAIRAGRVEWERKLAAIGRPRGGASLATFN
ncbi:hypothetical protein [Shewanella algae]|uniref:hypothetical protein n=1 Tax=Shewanella algae TaxID=38313 RepID=UPI0031F50023